MGPLRGGLRGAACLGEEILCSLRAGFPQRRRRRRIRQDDAVILIFLGLGRLVIGDVRCLGRGFDRHVGRGCLAHRLDKPGPFVDGRRRDGIFPQDRRTGLHRRLGGNRGRHHEAFATPLGADRRQVELRAPHARRVQRGRGGEVGREAALRSHAGIDLRRGGPCRALLGRLFQPGKAFGRARQHALHRFQRFAALVICLAQPVRDLRQRFFHIARGLVAAVFAFFQTLRQHVELVGQLTRHFRFAGPGKVFDLARDAVHALVHGVQRVLAFLFGLLQPFGKPGKALLETGNRVALAVGLRLVLERLQRRLHGLGLGLFQIAADAGKALLHLLQPLGEEREVFFLRFRALLFGFAFVGLLGLVDTRGELAQHVADIGQGIIGPLLAGVQMIDHRVHRLLQRLDRVLVLGGLLGAAAVLLRAFQPFGQMLQLAFQRIDNGFRLLLRLGGRMFGADDPVRQLVDGFAQTPGQFHGPVFAALQPS